MGFWAEPDGFAHANRNQDDGKFIQTPMLGFSNADWLTQCVTSTEFMSLFTTQCALLLQLITRALLFCCLYTTICIFFLYIRCLYLLSLALQMSSMSQNIHHLKYPLYVRTTSSGWRWCFNKKNTNELCSVAVLRDVAFLNLQMPPLICYTFFLNHND